MYICSKCILKYIVKHVRSSIQQMYAHSISLSSLQTVVAQFSIRVDIESQTRWPVQTEEYFLSYCVLFYITKKKETPKRRHSICSAANKGNNKYSRSAFHRVCVCMCVEIPYIVPNSILCCAFIFIKD